MKKLILIIMLLCVAVMPSCTKQAEKNTEKYTAYSLDYFDTATTITGYADDKAEFDRISGEILAELGEYHRLYTIYHRYDGLENLCTVNELSDGEHRVVSVDRRVVDMLTYAKEMHALTGGKLNVAMGSVLSIWHDYRTAGLSDPDAAELPPSDLLAHASAHTDIECLIIDSENCTVYISDPKATLDVGAIAKGYAVEMIAQGLEARGISGYVINVGGNVRTIGTKPDGSTWVAGVENPTDSDDAYIAYLQIAGESVVTSGSYQRFYTVNGKNYHHIIDPDTLAPAEEFISVSIVCDSSALGDSLSTALFCMSLDEGQALIASLPNAEALWILPDGTQITSEGWSRFVKS